MACEKMHVQSMQPMWGEEFGILPCGVNGDGPKMVDGNGL